MRHHPEHYLSFTELTPSKGGLDQVLMLAGRIHNTSKLTVKDPLVRCDLSTETDDAVGSYANRLYKVVPAGGDLDFKEFNVGLVNSVWGKADCKIESATMMDQTTPVPTPAILQPQRPAYASPYGRPYGPPYGYHRSW